MRVLYTAIGVLLIVLECHAQSTLKQCIEEDKNIDDIYDLDEWQNSTRSFGQTVFGFLGSNPNERYTIQRLLNIVKQNSGNKNTPVLELTTLLMKGYFAALPDYLNSTGGQQTVFGVGAVIEHHLSELVTDNFYHYKERNEKYFYSLTSMEQSIWLMKRINWQKVIVTILIAQPYEKYEPAGVDHQCYIDSVHMLRSFYMTKTWAIEMLDSAGKLPIGLFQGNLNWIGQYDECHLISANRTNLTSFETIEIDAFRGSYCDLKLELPDSLNIPKAPGQKIYLRLGVCFPSTCKAPDVKLIMNSVMANTKSLGVTLPEIESARCHSDSPSAKGEFKHDGVAWFAAILMGTIVLLVAVCSVIEGLFWYQSDDCDIVKDKPAILIKKTTTALDEAGMDNKAYVEMTQIHVEPNDNEVSKESGNGETSLENGKVVVGNGSVAGNGSIPSAPESKPQTSRPKDGVAKRLALTFSLYSNVPALLSTVQPRGSIKSLDALRVFNMNWIILGHMYSMGAVFMPETMSNAKLAVSQIKNWTFMGVYTGMLAVDSYFFISGLLVSYLFLKSCAKNNGKWKMQMIMYYVHRFIRILPLYAILILVYAAFGKYLGAGPLFDWETPRIRDCNNNWWANLLFINNFYKPREMCLGWSWYLANDMQFYIIAPMILIPLYWSALFGMAIILVMFLIHWAITFFLWFDTNGASYLQDKNIFYDAYITPYCRIGPYLVGLFLGWVFYKGYSLRRLCKGDRIVQWLVAIVCWACTVLILGLIVYVQFDDVKEYGVDKPGWNVWQRTLYETFSRDGWAVALAWIVYACNQGFGGFVAHILNWKGWTPLGRMTYAVYLVHPIVIFLYVGNRRDLNYLDNFSVAFTYAGYVLLSYVGGAILSLIYEWPWAGVEKVLLGNLRKPKAEKVQ